MCLFLGTKIWVESVCLSVYIKHTHNFQNFIYTSPSARLLAHSSFSYPLIPPISKPQSKARHINSLIVGI